MLLELILFINTTLGTDLFLEESSLSYTQEAKLIDEEANEILEMINSLIK